MSTEFHHLTPAPAGAAGAHTGHGPTEPVSRAWTALFGLVWFGYWTASLVPLQLLLPQQLEAIDPSAKVHDFAVVNAVSGLVALLALPLCGTLCDRSRSRFGRRRLWVTGGSLALAVGLAVTAQQTTVAGVTAAWAAAMVGLSAVTAGLTAVMADRVPVDQRGMVSSAIYGPQALGVVAGIALVSAFGLSPAGGYLVIAAMLVICAVPFVARYRDPAHSGQPPLRLRALLASLGNSLRNREFAWAFGGRLLVNLANSLGVCYTLYFLTDDLKVPDPASSLLACTAVYLVAGVLATSVVGVLSDRLGRRRIFVALTALLQAVSGFLLAAFPNLTVTLVASAIMGAGFGAYMSVDQALITQVLPDAESRAQDLGIMNIGSVLPPALAPLIASLIITSDRGYPVLFALVGATSALGVLLVYRVRSVR
ncbi:MFS transporter [Streptomyces pseudovenezuelae]|uniref:MFS transporter n=1 Tax=Streptomyces pseudovenezuelae TaxID=67350 RepID=UPI002E7FD79C|nr:MFS transporter [Streptomyces pseudovenezuelae]WUA86038.1 MFS transporter [Streptomyces pseudovenezuelae]